MHKSKGSFLDGVAGGFILCFAISILLIVLFSLFSALILGGLNDPTKNIGIFSLGSIDGGVCRQNVRRSSPLGP